jgi:hypothetical protein
MNAQVSDRVHMILEVLQRVATDDMAGFYSEAIQLAAQHAKAGDGDTAIQLRDAVDAAIHRDHRRKFGRWVEVGIDEADAATHAVHPATGAVTKIYPGEHEPDLMALAGWTLLH